MIPLGTIHPRPPPDPRAHRSSSRLLVAGGPQAGGRGLGQWGTVTFAVRKGAEAGTRVGLSRRGPELAEPDPTQALGQGRRRGDRPQAPAPTAGGKGGGSGAPRTKQGGGRREGGGAGRPGPGAGRRDSPLLPACGARVVRIPRSSDAEIRTRSNPSAIFAAAARAAATPPPPRAARKPRRTGGARAHPPPTLFPAPSRPPPQTTVAALGEKALNSRSAACREKSWDASLGGEGGRRACAEVWSGEGELRLELEARRR